MQKIKVLIKEDGSLEYDVKGVKGKTCKDITKFIDTLSNIKETKNTNEYYEREENKNHEKE